MIFQKTLKTFVFIAALAASSAFGQGLSKLSEVAEKKAEKGGEAQKTSPYFIGTSYGFYQVSKGGDDWRSSGGSDVFFGYSLSTQVALFELYATLRYAPADVAPSYKKDGRTEEYRGSLESYLAGTSGYRSFANGARVALSAELGLTMVHLRDIVELPDEDQPEDLGFTLALGSGIDWQVLEKVYLGPQLRLGLGTFTSAQLACNVTMAF